MTLTTVLTHAAKNLGQCAKAVETNATAVPLHPKNYERLIGFGMACDWIGWARHLEAISYSDKRRARSDRAHALNELTRFTFMWTAANALFARTEVLHLLDPTVKNSTSELQRFQVLFNNSGLSPASIAATEKALHALLSLPMHVQYFPWVSINNPPTILEVIYFKYTVPHEQTRGLGKKLIYAATTNNYSALDLPTLIYATRNWNIHGVLLSSSFRGTHKKFNVWIDTINLTLAQILNGSSKVLLGHV